MKHILSIHSAYIQHILEPAGNLEEIRRCTIKYNQKRNNWKILTIRKDQNIQKIKNYQMIDPNKIELQHHADGTPSILRKTVVYQELYFYKRSDSAKTIHL